MTKCEADMAEPRQAINAWAETKRDTCWSASEKHKETTKDWNSEFREKCSRRKCKGKERKAKS